ncbi:hypothetical protein F4809DRAFT_662902 [Biscogniauxia mediterranea]|nr:hypothetical protein F4809DRAFT_662902 [Biscogniauxia mediterranea]
MSAFEFPRSFDPPATTQGTIDPSLLQNHTAVSPGGPVPASSSHTENEVFQLSPSGGGDEDLPESFMHNTAAHVQSSQDTIAFPQPEHPNNHGHGNDEAAHEAGTNSTASGMSHTGAATLEYLRLSHPFLSECGLEFDSQWELYEHEHSLHAQGHCIADRRLFKCKCGQKFVRLFTLERHIESFQKSMPEYPCDECDTYKGNKGFPRKDHLVQHLRVFHKYEPAQLEARFPPRKSRVLAVSVCHIKSCEYYRGDGFQDQDLSWQEKERTRPFAKQSDYTAHMKKEHDWSPYPCDFPGCKKVDGKGFFSLTALRKHRDEQHPGMAPLDPRIVRKVKCGKCHKSIKPNLLQDHRCYYVF